jgi:hypothetical protein
MSTVDVTAARGVVLDLAERCAELEAELEDRLARDFAAGGGMAPPKGHELRPEFEAWAADAGCMTRGGLRAPVVAGRPLFRLPKGKWIKTPMGKQWAGDEAESWTDGGWSGAGGQLNDDWQAWRDRTAADIRALFELRRFAAQPPTAAELAEGWDPPSWLPLEEHEAQILRGEDPETGLPAPVAEWLGRLVHVPKREYAAAYCAHRLWGEDAPADPGTPWAEKARRRADKVLSAVAA